MSETAFQRLQDLPSTHLLGGGTAMCAGCGGLQALQTIYDVLGEKTVFVNAAGCMTLLSIYPSRPSGAPGSTPPWPRRRPAPRACATPSMS